MARHGRKRNLLQNVTHNAAWLLYLWLGVTITGAPAMADLPQKKTPLTPAQIERERKAMRDVTFRTIENEPPMDLVDRRQACSNHDLAKSNQKQEAKGQPMPSAHEECLKVLDVTARKGLENHLFVNLALQHQGILEYDSRAHDRLLQNGEATRTFRAIGRAARDGQTSYRTIRTDLPEDQQFQRLDCPLALDAGFSYGTAVGSQPMQVLSPRARDAVVKLCYNPDLKGDQMLEIEGEKMPLNKAGLLAGENIGRELRAKLDATQAPVTDPLKTPARTQAGPASPPASKPVQR